MYPKNRIATHPGEVLLEDFIKPLGLTQRELADAINVYFQNLNEIINGRRGISVIMAMKLAKFFETSVEFWINLQTQYDLTRFIAKKKEDIEKIKEIPSVKEYMEKKHKEAV